MSKLTEIKERMGATNLLTKFGFFTETEQAIYDDVRYLLSLLEEKDEALAFYGDKKSYQMNDEQYEIFMNGGYAKYPITEDAGNIARKALNTSSNNEGES